MNNRFFSKSACFKMHDESASKTGAYIAACEDLSSSMPPAAAELEKSPNIFNLPDLGEGLPDAELREWYVKEGDYVEIDQPIALLETAKTLVDIPSPCSGYILKRYPKTNDIINTGAPLVSFTSLAPELAERGKSQNQDNTATTAVLPLYEMDKFPPELTAECKNPAESMPQTRTNTTVYENVSPSALQFGTNLELEQSNEVTSEEKPTKSNTIQAMPAVKALARKFNIDLASITPTAPNGSITLDDVKNAICQGETLRGPRRVMAMNMTQRAEINPTILCEDADIHAWDDNEDYTLRLIRALIIACQVEPALNAHYFSASMSRKLFTDIHLGLAMDTATGLYVPVLKNVAAIAASELRQKINQLKKEALAQSFSNETLTGASIILSNFGSIGGRYAVPAILAPIVAIIASGKARDQVVAVAGKPEVHKIIPLTLAFDHRVVTGGEAARFLMAMIKDLSHPSAV